MYENDKCDVCYPEYIFYEGECLTSCPQFTE